MTKQAVFKKDGDKIDYICIASVSIGEVIPLGTNKIGIASSNGLSGEVIALNVKGIWEINAKTADVISIGDELYWDDVNSELTITDTSNTYAGVATTSKAAAAAGTVWIWIG